MHSGSTGGVRGNVQSSKRATLDNEFKMFPVSTSWMSRRYLFPMMQSGGIRLDGRKLFIVEAVSKEDAVKLKVNRAKVETGSRNLYLAREGCESNPFLMLVFLPSQLFR